MRSSAEPSREGLHLPRRWVGRDFVPFDEIEALEADRVRLSSGEQRRLAPGSQEQLSVALNPPAATGRLQTDAAVWTRYTAGAWSPRRAGQALIDMAARCGASDIHLEAADAGYTIRLRLSGEMVSFTSLPLATGRRLLAALKHLSSCLPYRSDIVQEGRIPRSGVAADVRASFMPTALGERAALRLFGRLHQLADLGLPDDMVMQLEAVLQAPSGLLIVAGPSGGGKTTTVYAALAYLAHRRGGAHLSIEDPVEQRLRVAGVAVDQVELQPERGLTAEAALVGALRQDVDVVALSEVRRPAEAALALEAAHTGRLAIVGLHAGSAQEASQRMLDLGADPAVLQATLRGVLHQRLITVPCPDGADASCARCHGLGRIRRPAATLWTPAPLPQEVP